MIVGNFNLRPNTYHKGKENGVDNRGERRQVMTVRIDSKEGGEGGVDSRTGKRNGQMAVAAATKGTTAVTAEETTLNSLTTEVTFREIVLTDLGASKKTLSLMVILGLEQLAANAHILDSCN